ncbi:MAG TPA: IS256 family transposase [candidate division Zixibacteria bacterium]|nr:IS256 family transposase [candidate division Zixibacteria bacterium]
MTDITMAFMELLRKHELDIDSDFLREGVQIMMQKLIELEAEQQIGAGLYERKPERVTYRNGYRTRLWETRVGEVPLRIPKLREGTYFPSLLEPRKRSEQALLAVIQEAYIKGVSTRKVDDMVQALGLRGVDKSKVSRITKNLDELVQDFRHRPLEDEYPYVWLDALYLKVRQNHRVVSLAVVVAVAVASEGGRTILGFDVGASEEEAFWLQFLRTLVKRGLKGVRLVISDAHEGLKAAVNTVFAGASWQRCRVHFVRNVLAHIPKGDKAMIAAGVRTIFAQPDRKAAGQQLRYVAKTISTRWPRASQLLLKAEDDVLAFMAFPKAHWTRIYSTNILERLNKEVKRRTNVVEIFPDIPSVIRLVGTLLAEADDEWQIHRRYFSNDSMRHLYEPTLDMLAEPTPLTLAPVR